MNNQNEDNVKAIRDEIFGSFYVAEMEVAINDIREIINYSDDIVEAPGMPAFVKGVLNLRGKLITIVEARSLYLMKPRETEKKETKILIFESGDERFGLVVDSLESIVTVDDEQKRKVPSIMVQKIQSQFENDIKEIVTFKQTPEKEAALVILNVGPLTSRIRETMAA